MPRNGQSAVRPSYLGTLLTVSHVCQRVYQGTERVVGGEPPDVRGRGRDIAWYTEVQETCRGDGKIVLGTPGFVLPVVFGHWFRNSLYLPNLFILSYLPHLMR